MADTRKVTKAFTENAFETTLTSVFNSTDTTISVNSTGSLSGSGPAYIVVNPDDADKREYIFVDGTITATTMQISTLDNRYLDGSAQDSGIDHASGDRVRISPMSQHFDDLWGAIGKVVDVDYSSSSAESIKFAGEVDASSNKITNLADPTAAQDAATKTYVDTKVTAEDLDITDGTTTSSVDLDSQTMTIQGTSNEVDVSLTGQDFTVGLPTNVTIAGTLDVTTNIDLEGNIDVDGIVYTDDITEKTTDAGITFNSNITLADGKTVTGFPGGGVVNKIINGSFDVWQRGTSFTSTGYTADRWRMTASGTGTTTVSQQAFTFGQTTVPDNPKYYIRLAKSSGSTSGYADHLSQRIENSATFAQTECTYSFWAKSSAGGQIQTVWNQNFGTGGSPSTATSSTLETITTTTSWVKYTHSFTPASVSGKTIGTDDEGTSHYAEFKIKFQGGASETFEIAQVQVERGGQANDFAETDFDKERTKCLRYYQKYVADGANQIVGYGAFTRSDAIDAYFPYMAPLRTNPTLSAGGNHDFVRSGDVTTVNSPGFNQNSGGTTGLGSGSGIYRAEVSGPDGHGGTWVLNSGGYIIIDAEL